MTCSECGEKRGQFEDPREPPVDEGKCLCRPCFVDACDEAICELQTQVSQLEKERDEAAKKLKHYRVRP